MSQIRIYPSVIRTFEGAPTQPIETHDVNSGTLRDWLLANVPSYADNPDHNPWEVELEGARDVIVDPADYASVSLSGVAVVHLYAAPKGGAVSSLFNAVVDLFSSVFSWLMPDIPTPNANGQTDQGAQINDPSVTINRPKLNGVINQIAGQTKIAPYYLAPPHSYFIDPRTKCVDILLCVGWGSYALPASQIRIGETPINALGNDVNWQAYMPGENIGGHPAHELWYTAPEVGAAGNGQAGLKLKSTVPITPALTAPYIDVSSDTITVPAGTVLPSDWDTDLLLNVLIDRQLVMQPPGLGDNLVTGFEQGAIDGDSEDLILTTGDFRTTEWFSVVGGQTYTMAILSGDSDRRRVQWRLSDDSIEYVSGNASADGYSITAPADAVEMRVYYTRGSNMGELGVYQVMQRARITGQFADLGLSVGESIVITGSALEGEYVVHSATASELTLSYPDLSPLTGPTSGTYQATIDRLGARYRVVTIVGESITVEKQLADGNPDTAWAGWENARYHNNWRIRVDDIYAEGEWLGPFSAQKSGTLINRLQAIVLMPRGLGKAETDYVRWRKRSVELEWREIGATEWVSVPFEMEEGTRDQLGFTIDVELPQPMAVECRLRRSEPELTDIQSLDEMHWTQLSSRLAESPTQYNDITVLALTIVGSDSIAGQSENRITCVPTSIIKTMDGTNQPTRGIADFARIAANQSGIPDDEIDMDEMQRLHDVWTARGDTFDFNHDSDDTVKAVLQRALAAGFAEPVWDDVLVPVRDEPRTQLGQMYSPQNMRADALLSKSIRSIRPDDYQGVDVEYQSALTNTVETVECRLPGYTDGRIETIRVEGVTDETRAWRHGMRRLMRHRHIRKGYSWGTPTDALNSHRGELCPVVGPIPSRAQSALIEKVVVNAEGVHLRVDQPLNWDSIEQHVIYWRKPDGEAQGPYNATRGEDDYHVIAAMGSDPAPEVDPQKEPPHLIFGRVERVLVKSIKPKGMSNVDLEAEGYDERLYQYDDAVPE
ncbi:host specificity factor TipJ family phage tail protein [Halomonas venusta]|uniref:host specificity factor TipJ family phage tail protein n=1 Tax=Vreelandella venusta TaxID=44935 RepID=UPI00295F3DB1|nr:host specificity factor TipJ family phage tail protein [Halomonas venusta]MDW0360792.1 host specificity factor TipJ family phage tail protein [Halomonas venusta]